MARTHGLLNGLVFVPAGRVGWHLAGKGWVGPAILLAQRRAVRRYLRSMAEHAAEGGAPEAGEGRPQG